MSGQIILHRCSELQIRMSIGEKMQSILCEHICSNLLLEQNHLKKAFLMTEYNMHSSKNTHQKPLISGVLILFYNSMLLFSAHLNKVQEELLHYPWCRRRL